MDGPTPLVLGLLLPTKEQSSEAGDPGVRALDRPTPRSGIGIRRRRLSSLRHAQSGPGSGQTDPQERGPNGFTVERSIAGLAPRQEKGERAMTCDHRIEDRTHADPHALRNRLRGLDRTAGSAAPRRTARRGGHRPHRLVPGPWPRLPIRVSGLKPCRHSSPLERMQGASARNSSGSASSSNGLAWPALPFTAP